eukprot:g1533.t1
MSSDAESCSDARKAVFVESEDSGNETLKIRGHDFNKSRNLDDLMERMLYSGFQASHLGQAINEVNQMLKWRLSDEPIPPGTEGKFADPEIRAHTRCKIFLGYTSNLVSSGVREQIRFLVQHQMIDVLVTSAGGIEEDLIKCMGNTYLGDFSLKGAELRKRGLNRIGNLLVPNSNYCAFEDWIIPILDTMLVEQNEQGIKWTPSKASPQP